VYEIMPITNNCGQNSTLVFSDWLDPRTCTQMLRWHTIVCVLVILNLFSNHPFMPDILIYWTADMLAIYVYHPKTLV
jgi:hypothetical protein